jgi:hypothetical protein
MDGDLGLGSPMAAQHDKIFKQLLHAFLDDFLRLVVPETLDRLDLSSPEFLDKELFAGGPRGRRRELDLLVRVRTVQGRPLLIHVEIEARAKPGMEDRLWLYRNQIQARYETPVLTPRDLPEEGPARSLPEVLGDRPRPGFPGAAVRLLWPRRLPGGGVPGPPRALGLGSRGSYGTRTAEPRRTEDGLLAPNRRFQDADRSVPTCRLRRKLSTIRRAGSCGV